MKRLLFLMLLFASLFNINAEDVLATEVGVSFSYNYTYNIGFSDRPISGLAPVDTSSFNNVAFGNFNADSKSAITDNFYIYWQKYSDIKIRIIIDYATHLYGTNGGFFGWSNAAIDGSNIIKDPLVSGERNDTFSSNMNILVYEDTKAEAGAGFKILRLQLNQEGTAGTGLDTVYNGTLRIVSEIID